MDVRLSTFSIEDTLPSLPLPNLDQTLAKYLYSIKPFVSKEEYTRTKEVCDRFKNGIGTHLQANLKERALRKRNWLEDWWLEWAYLEWREPLAPYINTIGHYVNLDECIDKQGFVRGQSLQNAIASLQIHYIMKFYDDLKYERFPIEKSKSGYLSMNQYRCLFNTCRIPCISKDSLHSCFKTYNEGTVPSNILIIYKNRFFSFNGYHPNNLSILNPNEIYSILNRTTHEKTHGIGIGALTADKRDDWAQNRQYLIHLNEKNKEFLSKIENAILVVCLDDNEVNNNDELSQVALLSNAKNRFFDKSYQLIVTKSGHISANTDHTPFDGIVSVNLAHNVLKNMTRDRMNYASKVATFPLRSGFDQVEELDFMYDSKIESEIDKCERLFKKNASNINVKTKTFEYAPKSDIKQYDMHPDTFCQMVLQLAYFKLHLKPAPTYETASTRAYYHGRTETMRTCTPEVHEWLKCMINVSLSKQEKLRWLKVAAKNHEQLIGEASDNHGCDRHLLGLKLVAQELGVIDLELFSDASFTKSGGNGNFHLSTSCIGFTNVFGGCAPMCENGYGCFYRIGDEGTTFFVSNYKSSHKTCCFKMINSIGEAIRDIQSLFETISKV